jgi:hypothetical protein
MGTDSQRRKKGQFGNEPSLKGAFASVMLLGVFLLVAWVSVFILFLSRQ